jgi:hypothetical protein
MSVPYDKSLAVSLLTDMLRIRRMEEKFAVSCTCLSAKRPSQPARCVRSLPRTTLWALIGNTATPWCAACP